MADIAINPVTRRVQFTGNTGTGPFAFTFNVLQASDIVVYKNNVQQTLTTDYSVTINANGTGSITLVSALVNTDVLIIVGGRELSRTTDFVTSGDLLAASLNEQLDSNVIMSQQLDERISRAIRSQPGDELKDLYLPLKADRADKLLSFDTEGNVTAQAAADLLTGSVLGSNYVNNTATGDGSTVAFGVTVAPGSKNNIQIYIDGVYQNKATFSISGSTVTFSEAPPLNAAIEFVIGSAVTSISGDADGITYTQGGTGSQQRTVESKLQEFVSVKDFGAVGDGVTDDTAAIQAAYAAHKQLFFPNGTYIIAPTTTKTPTGFGRSLYYLLEITSNTSFLGETGATIKLKDNFSTDAAPKEVPLFLFETGIANFRVENLTFDYNKDNNPISPDRGSGTYNRFRNQVVMGWRAGCQEFVFKNNVVKNVNGVNCVVLAEPLSGDSISERRAMITGNTFINVGFDTDDHSSIVTYQQGTIIDNNIFYNGSLPPGAPTAVELHNKDCTFSNSQVLGGGFYRGFYAASNLNTDVSNLMVSGNNFNVETIGGTILTNDSHDGVENVVIDGNNFFVNANIPSTSSPTLTHSILQIRNEGTDSGGFLRNIVISNNTMGYPFPSSSTTRLRHGILLTHSGSPAPATRNVSIYGNTIRYCSHGVDIDLNSGDGLLESIVINNNTFEHMTSQHGGDGVGIYFNPDNLAPTEYANFSNNSFYYTGSTANEFDDGISIRQAIEHIRIDGNDFYGVDTNVQNNSNDQVGLYGSELRSGWTAAPSFGTWQQGDIVYRGNPSAGGTIGWVCVTGGSPGTWKTFGTIAS